jgi:FixJ family two-component response regulator
MTQALNNQSGSVTSLSSDKPIVFLHEGDLTGRDLLESPIAAQEWRSETFESISEFIARTPLTVPHALLLPFNLADSFEHALQQMNQSRPCTSIVILSHQMNIPGAVRAIRTGAVDVLLRPIDITETLLALRRAIERSSELLDRDLVNCYETLSQRERQVMALITSGLSNKRVAGQLGIVEVTVKRHRAQVMRKMRAISLPGLVQMAAALGFAARPIPRSRRFPEGHRSASFHWSTSCQ